MSRNTVQELELVFDTTLTDPQLQAFLDTADIIVTANLGSTNLSTDELKQIEKFLGAHFASLMDPRELRAKTGDADAWFYPNVTTAWGKQLNLTPYGQQVLMMDRTGTLAKLGEKRGSYRAAPREDSDNFTSGLTKS